MQNVQSGGGPLCGGRQCGDWRARLAGSGVGVRVGLRGPAIASSLSLEHTGLAGPASFSPLFCQYCLLSFFLSCARCLHNCCGVWCGSGGGGQRWRRGFRSGGHCSRRRATARGPTGRGGRGARGLGGDDGAGRVSLGTTQGLARGAQGAHGERGGAGRRPAGARVGVVGCARARDAASPRRHGGKP